MPPHALLVLLAACAGLLAVSGAEASLIARAADARTVDVRARPDGPVVARLAGKTEFGSPIAFSVVARAGRWVGVRSAAVPNGRIAWVDHAKVPLRFTRTALAIDVDLSARTLVLRRGERVLRRAAVAVGRPGLSTPTGRFAVTDKLPGRRFGSAYGCCILALSGTQPNTPRGWTGGNRLAIHGGAPASIGKAVSAGCLRAHAMDLRALMAIVPLGTPVTIRR